jgi:hypothetical protein
MIRSQKRTPIAGLTTAKSEKDDKRLPNRRIRRRVKVVLAGRPEDDLLPTRRELSNPWTMAKDGKIWLDPDLYLDELRK